MPLTLVGVTYLLASQASGVLKQIFDRARPPRAFPQITTLLPLPHDASFPSGHAATSFACAVVLAAFLQSRRSRSLLFALAALIALSRVYVGVHYPLDVVVGAALGAAIGAAALQATRFIGEGRRSDLFARFEDAGDDDGDAGEKGDPETDAASAGR